MEHRECSNSFHFNLIWMISGFFWDRPNYRVKRTTEFCLNFNRERFFGIGVEVLLFQLNFKRNPRHPIVYAIILRQKWNWTKTSDDDQGFHSKFGWQLLRKISAEIRMNFFRWRSISFFWKMSAFALNEIKGRNTIKKWRYHKMYFKVKIIPIWVNTLYKFLQFYA